MFYLSHRTDENRVWYKNYVESAVKVPDGAEGSDWLAGHEAVSEGSEFFAFHTICSIAKEFSIVSGDAFPREGSKDGREGN
jgi:hypothetical protein